MMRFSPICITAHEDARPGEVYVLDGYKCLFYCAKDDETPKSIYFKQRGHIPLVINETQWYDMNKKVFGDYFTKDARLLEGTSVLLTREYRSLFLFGLSPF